MSIDVTELGITSAGVDVIFVVAYCHTLKLPAILVTLGNTSGDGVTKKLHHENCHILNALGIEVIADDITSVGAAVILVVEY